MFGVAEEGSQKVVVFRVPDRTRETLVQRIITTHILPGTIIYFDQFTQYIPLNQLGYIHLSVNHCKNFVDPDSGAHTNTIEGVWALIKKKLKWMCGTLSEYIPSYLDEFTRYRNFGKNQAFELLLEDIAEQFPLQYAFWETSEECHFLIQGFQMHFLKICSTDRFSVVLHDLQTLSLPQGLTMTF